MKLPPTASDICRRDFEKRSFDHFGILFPACPNAQPVRRKAVVNSVRDPRRGQGSCLRALRGDGAPRKLNHRPLFGTWPRVPGKEGAGSTHNQPRYLDATTRCEDLPCLREDAASGCLAPLPAPGVMGKGRQCRAASGKFNRWRYTSAPAGRSASGAAFPFPVSGQEISKRGLQLSDENGSGWVGADRATEPSGLRLPGRVGPIRHEKNRVGESSARFRCSSGARPVR